jgi:GNAT superfamily N-acetyltransferase
MAAGAISKALEQQIIGVSVKIAAMKPAPVILLDEDQCAELDAFLAERIYESNAKATGYFDGKLLGGSLRSDTGEIIAGFNGHTWGACCEISHLWVIEAHRGHGLGAALLQAAEQEARRRGCEQIVLSTHSFQAPAFYERHGYEPKYAIEGRPKGHSNIIYAKLLAAQ